MQPKLVCKTIRKNVHAHARARCSPGLPLDFGWQLHMVVMQAAFPHVHYALQPRLQVLLRIDALRT
jgi:hypothetical protein